MPCYTSKLSEGSMVLRLVPVAELVATYLQATAPQAFCDPRLAAEVQELLDPC